MNSSEAYYASEGRPIPAHISDPSRRKALAINKRATTGWPAWSVPCSLLVKFIEDSKQQLEADYTPLPNLNTATAKYYSTPTDLNPWRVLLTQRMSTILKRSPDVIERRLYDVMSNKTKVVKAEFAEAAAISVGKLLDHGTDLPVLPGSHWSAKELISVRAEIADIDLAPLEIKRLAYQTQRISWLIVEYPHNLERLQDLAPFDCLRPLWR